MKLKFIILGPAFIAMILACGLAVARSSNPSAQATRLEDAPALTIYNQKFAVVRQNLRLDVQAGVNHVEVSDISGHLEPDSVILRSTDANRNLQILEQNYRNDPVTQQLLLSLYEGKTIDFIVSNSGGSPQFVKGKIIRSGYVPHSTVAYSDYGPQSYQAQYSATGAGADQPIIEVDGRLQFSLPGQPVFPALGDDTVLKPTLTWELQTDKGGSMPAELSYVTQGMTWEASYNIVAPVKGNELELVGWVTLDNQSGKTYRDARIKLMAGDVNKIRPTPAPYAMKDFAAAENQAAAMTPPVTERNFDEYHLYTLAHLTTLLDRETKQVEFVRSAGIRSETIYVYDGLSIEPGFQNWSMENIRQQENFGLRSNPKVWVMQEFKNNSGNHLGIPLPRGRVRFYRRDSDGQLEFTGENAIDHTPKDETIRLYTGNAFDLTGERRRTDYRIDAHQRWIDESFEIKLRNHKDAPTEVQVVEHLYRSTNWEIRANSDPYEKSDSQTIQFTVNVAANSERTINYQVHYSW